MSSSSEQHAPTRRFNNEFNIYKSLGGDMNTASLKKHLLASHQNSEFTTFPRIKLRKGPRTLELEAFDLRQPEALAPETNPTS